MSPLCHPYFNLSTARVRRQPPTPTDDSARSASCSKSQHHALRTTRAKRNWCTVQRNEIKNSKEKGIDLLELITPLPNSYGLARSN